MRTPEPVAAIVCSVCEHKWDVHVQYAGYDYDDETRLTPTLETCLQVLKAANAGPPGPVGPMGPAGMNGRNA